jgi:3-oxoacyl-[acyl-carrier-protein] synthase-3
VCTGFAYALATAEKFIRSGSHKRALVVGPRSSRASSTGTIAAPACSSATVPARWCSRPATAGHPRHGAACGWQPQPHPVVPGQINRGEVVGDPFLRMDGQAVFKFAVKVLVDVAREVMAEAGVGIDDVDWLIPHQANIRIIQATGKRLGVPVEKVIATVGQHGNTSAASIPLALDLAVRDGRIQRGTRFSSKVSAAASPGAPRCSSSDQSSHGHLRVGDDEFRFCVSGAGLPVRRHDGRLR